LKRPISNDAAITPTEAATTLTENPILGTTNKSRFDVDNRKNTEVRIYLLDINVIHIASMHATSSST